MKALILLSGGVDSAVLLAHRLHYGDECVALTFDYGQTHSRERYAAMLVANHYRVDSRLVSFHLGGSALTGQGEIPDGHAETVDATYVPARNLVMIAIAAHFAERLEASSVLFGANADDWAGYPDCRPKFLASIDQAVNLGTARGISVAAPFMNLTKPDIVALGRELDAPLDLTWSCYRNDDQPCGRCGACITREAALACRT